VIAALALLVALGGTGYAAVTLPPNSVGARELKNNAVTGAKVRNRSLLAVDFKAGQLPVGPAGPAGPQGAKGDKGDAATNLWAVVNANGRLSRWSGATVSARSSAGRYEVTFNRDVSNCAAVATIGNTTSTATPPTGRVQVTTAQGKPAALLVVTYALTGAASDRPFHLAAFC
jgi:hypothetical protein